MGEVIRAAVAGGIATLMLAGTEALVAYPRPSFAAGAFFKLSFLTYLPFLTLTAWILLLAFDRRGLDLWLPFLAAWARVMDGLAADGGAHSWVWPVVVAVLAMGALVVQRVATRQSTSPPFMFGLTVGVVLPILAARAVMGLVSFQLGTADRALALGAFVGLVVFVGLRSAVARWPSVGPIFALGPVISLVIWSRQGQAVTVRVTDPGSSGSGMAVSHARPDIVLIVLDTVRAQSLLSYGSPRNTMPNLESFAGGATTYRRAWTNGSWTLPAHASLFSGLDTARHGYDSGFPAADRVPADGFLASQLRTAGYATGAVAANFGVFGREDPLLRGFESVEVEPLRPFAFKPWFFSLLTWFPHADWLQAQRAVFPGPSMRAPWVIERAEAFWSTRRTQPRFLFVNFMEAHLPWVPDAEDMGRFGSAGLGTEPEQLAVLGRYLHGGRASAVEADVLRARYEESLATLDRSLSRLLDTVTRDPNTIVVVTSDHGESLGEHDRFGHRNSLDEAATRIPLFIRGPHQTGTRGVVDAPSQLVDVFGYLAAEAGIPRAAGLDALPFGDRRYVVIEHRPGPQGALPSSYPRGDLSGLIDWPYKYIEGPAAGESLYDLSADPTEEHDLSLIEQERTASMRTKLKSAIGRPSSRVEPDEKANERLKALGYLR